MAAFDHEDAAQEARIGLWQAGSQMQTVAYRKILDAVRKLHSGYRQRQTLALVPIDDHDQASDAPGPEEIADWNRRILLMETRLSNSDRELVAWVAAGGAIKDIALSRGVTSPAISQQFKRIILEVATLDEPIQSKAGKTAAVLDQPAPIEVDPDLDRQSKAAQQLFDEAMGAGHGAMVVEVGPDLDRQSKEAQQMYDEAMGAGHRPTVVE